MVLFGAPEQQCAARAASSSMGNSNIREGGRDWKAACGLCYVMGVHKQPMHSMQLGSVCRGQKTKCNNGTCCKRSYLLDA